jgi:hypothetical protein
VAGIPATEEDMVGRYDDGASRAGVRSAARLPMPLTIESALISASPWLPHNAFGRLTLPGPWRVVAGTSGAPRTAPMFERIADGPRHATLADGIPASTSTWSSATVRYLVRTRGVITRCLGSMVSLSCQRSGSLTGPRPGARVARGRPSIVAEGTGICVITGGHSHLSIGRHASPASGIPRDVGPPCPLGRASRNW